MNTHIRPACTEDLHSILHIMNHEILHGTALYDIDPRSDTYISQWYQSKIQRQLPVLVAIDSEQQVTGYATYDTFRDKQACLRTMEHSIYIHPSHQHQGIGTQLLKAIIDQAYIHRLHTLIAGIDSHNLISISMHEAHGFTTIGELQEVAYKFDQWLDLILMQKKLH